MNTLIIAEKPSVALRMAIALGDGKQRRLNYNGVGYYQIDTDTGTVYIAPAVGHIFTLAQSDTRHGYPVLDVEWTATYKVRPKSDYTKKYLDVFMHLRGSVDSYINACDYDTEGTVIGTNIIKHMSDRWESMGKRMKFSTTTIPDLKEAFANLMPLDIKNFYAGEARHTLDWLWGINLSRALTSAVGTSRSGALSIGRVQGPTLAILARRENEIVAFKPRPYWKVTISADNADFENTRGDMFDKQVAQQAEEETKKRAGSAIVETVESTEQLSRPYPPFDLTSLQLEASRALKYDPSSTLAVAQSLYERSYISYPRTSSQKLPPTLGLPKIIEELSKNPAYTDHAKKLISERRFRPNEGVKSDEAHPAIHPTGVMPKELSPTESKLYDLIVTRFLACFAGYAKIAKSRVVIKAGSERYSANGSTVVEKGWMDIYRYARTGDKMLPSFEQGRQVNISNITLNELETLPPKRYSKAMLLSELEKRDLGTKATRAAIIDTLFKRGYIDGAPIRTTGFGMSVYNALNDNVSMIVNEETTRQLEKDMEEIVQGKKSESEVISEGKEMLIKALTEFDANKDKISKAMQQGLSDAVPKVGKCPKDGGDLIMRRSRAGKQFVACANYPKCTQTFSVPQYALIIPMGKACNICGMPVIKVARKGKGAFEMCLNPDCESKAGWKKKITEPDQKAKATAPPPQSSEQAHATKSSTKKTTAVGTAVKTAKSPSGQIKIKKVRAKKKK